MKLKDFFKLLGLAMFLVALVLFLLSQNQKIDPIVVLFPAIFGIVITLSGGCLILGELIGKIEKLEEHSRLLEEELRKLQEQSQNKE